MKMKKLISITLCMALLIALVAGCGSTTTSSTSEDEKSPPDLNGEWREIDFIEEFFQTATINGDTIEIYWLTEGGEQKFLYWAGSYLAPTTTVQPYIWESENDRSKTDDAPIASSEDTKTITYLNGVLSYEATALDVTATIKLERISATTSSTNPKSAEETSKSTGKEDAKVEVTSERIIKYKSSLGFSEALYLAEVKNVGSKAVKIDDISIDVEDLNGSIINTKNYVSVFPNVINSGETAYICERLLDVTSKIDLNTVGNAILHYDISKKADVPPLEVEITDDKIVIEYGRPKLVGRIENKSNEELTMLYIAFPIFDENSELVTVGFTIINSLKPGEKKGFDQTATDCDPGIDYTKGTYMTIPYKYVMF